FAAAERDIVYGTTLSVYAQSREESEAHAVKSSKGLLDGQENPSCNANRAYIEFTDTGLWATAVAVSITERTVNIIYDDEQPSRLLAGHVDLPCKILSIWW
ncbi:MAG: hypothetical protein D3916_17230, partial [Candidatus Electrothrix sp. MAN1_4]|nr:hypothetical protein [Candidatus Electrothrix sp. MAN1_4]